MNPGLNSRSCWKLLELKQIIADTLHQGKLIPFIAVAETWLKPHVTDAQLSIESYQIFRADRVLPLKMEELYCIYLIRFLLIYQFLLMIIFAAV